MSPMRLRPASFVRFMVSQSPVQWWRTVLMGALASVDPATLRATCRSRKC